jgi:hypothetical protein
MASAARQIVFTTAPLTFDREGALAYTGLSPKLFDRLERERAIVGRRLGRHGAVIYQRVQLDAVTASLFEGSEASNDLDDEL